MWDPIAAAAADLGAPFVHPTLQVRALVERLNGSDVDLLVLGGDLVDHVYERPRADGPSPPNAELLAAELAAVRVPWVAIPGNHDYRLYPYRPRVYGLSSTGVPAHLERAVLEAAGAWHWLPATAADLDSLRIDPHRTVHTAHFGECPRRIEVSGSTLALLDTGPDLLVQLGKASISARTLRAVAASWGSPDSVGVDAAQVTLADGADAVFLHAPLLAPRGEIDLPIADALARRDLARGVCHHGAAALLAATSGPPPRVLVSGHVHRAGALQVRGGRIRTLPTTGVADADADAVLLTAPALGHVGHGPEGVPGYLELVLGDGPPRWTTHRLTAA